MTPTIRRAALAGLLVLAAILAAMPTPTVAQAAPATRTTIILSPHPDDEVIKLAHYTTIAADRGDRMILVQATDGSGSAVAGTLGLTPAELSRYRYREQDAAWVWLTDGREEIVRLGLQDGHAREGDIYAGLRRVLDDAPGAEVYVATYHHDRATSTPSDKHPDHAATVLAARRVAAEGAVVRYAIHPTSSQKAYSYVARNARQQVRVEGAVSSYAPIGRRSTPNLDRVVGVANRITS